MKKFLQILLGIITILAGVALLLTDVLSFIQPVPVLYLLCPMAILFSSLFWTFLILSVCWALMRKWIISIICAVIILISLPNTFKTYSTIPLSDINATTDSTGAISIMSYNVKLFHWFENDGVEAGNKTLEYISHTNPDVVCLQEMLYQYHGTYNLNYIKSKLDAYPYCHILVLNKNKRVAKCVATFSKFPIVERDDINFEASCHGAILTKIRKGADTINVLNFYLQSNQLTKNEKDIIPDVSASTESTGVISKVYNKLVKANVERGRQAMEIASEIEDIDKQFIMCGDMNDVPASFTYRTLSNGHSDSFLQLTSFSSGYTFHEKPFNFRIDYIFTSGDVTPISFRIDNSVCLSDHDPLILRFKIKE